MRESICILTKSVNLFKARAANIKKMKANVQKRCPKTKTELLLLCFPNLGSHWSLRRKYYTEYLPSIQHCEPKLTIIQGTEPRIGSFSQVLDPYLTPCKLYQNTYLSYRETRYV